MWKMVKLGDVCDFQNGFAFKNSDYSDTGYFVIRITNVQQGYISTKNQKYAKIDDTLKPSKFILSEGDILLSLTGDVGRVGILKQEHLPAALNQRVARVINSLPAKIDNRFLFHFMKSNSFRHQVESLAHGVAQANVSTKDIATLDYPLLPIKEQRRIVAILDKADAICQKQQQALTLADNFLRATFLDMFGDPVTNPKGWDIQPLGELCRIRRGASPRPINDFLGGNIPWIKIGDGTNGDNLFIRSTKDHITENGVKRSLYLEKESLIFANCGVSLGFARILKTSGCIHDGWLAFDKIEASLDKVFLLKQLNSVTQYFRKIAPDGTQPNLNIGIMKEFPIILPPLELQQKYTKILHNIYSSTGKIKIEAAHSEKLFSSLSQHAFRGGL